MAQVTFSVRMDEELKRQFEALCNEFGMNASTAVNVFARAVVREKKILFEITSSEADPHEKALQAFYALREHAKTNGLQNMTETEIEKEIHAARNGKA